MIRRRHVLASLAALTVAPRARAQTKPERLVFVGDPGAWAATFHKEASAAFEQKTGIRIEATILPVDALNTRLKSELMSNDGGIDVVQWTSQWRGWIHRYLEDHGKLMASAGDLTPNWNWNDFIDPALEMSRYDGMQLGVPYRAVVSVLHYQPALLRQAGVQAVPTTFDELRDAAIACTKAGAPARYGIGIFGKQGAALTNGWAPFLLCAGGRCYDPKTYAVEINDEHGVAALEFYGDLVTKWKVTPPEVTTWEFDEIMSGGEQDRYAMAEMLAPFGSQINDPRLSRTAGKWAWTQTPGLDPSLRGRGWISGWSFAVPTSSRNKQWAAEFLRFATSHDWMVRSMDSGNLPPCKSVLSDPAVLKNYGWAAASAEGLAKAEQGPSDDVWGTMEARLRSGISQVLLGERQAKPALDAVAADWNRTLRRAGLLKT